jgi:hypothetical protein
MSIPNTALQAFGTLSNLQYLEIGNRANPDRKLAKNSGAAVLSTEWGDLLPEIWSEGNPDPTRTFDELQRAEQEAKNA